tara:strand:- start:117 stop:761 length:645 start_codon:yes stop_codon:yes gene_type:complete
MTKKPERVGPKKFKSNTYERLIENIPTEILELRKTRESLYEYGGDWFHLDSLFIPSSSNFSGFVNTYYEEGGLKCQEILNDIGEADQEIHLDKQGNLTKFKIYFYGYYGLIADVIAIGAIVIYFENNTFLKRKIVPSETMEDYLFDDDLDAVVVVKELYENYVEKNEKDKGNFVKSINVNFSEIYKKGTLKELSFRYVNEEFKQEVLFWHDQET